MHPLRLVQALITLGSVNSSELNNSAIFREIHRESPPIDAATRLPVGCRSGAQSHALSRNDPDGKTLHACLSCFCIHMSYDRKGFLVRKHNSYMRKLLRRGPIRATGERLRGAGYKVAIRNVVPNAGHGILANILYPA